MLRLARITLAYGLSCPTAFPGEAIDTWFIAGCKQSAIASSSAIQVDASGVKLVLAENDEAVDLIAISGSILRST